MPHRVRLAEIIKALSRALDMTEGQPPGHCIGCCHIGTAIGHSLGLGETELRDLYYTLMLKDLGCTSNAPASARSMKRMTFASSAISSWWMAAWRRCCVFWSVTQRRGRSCSQG